jgi:hypothetical protein
VAVIIPRSWRDELCEPCGLCRACQQRHLDRANLKRLRAELAKARRLLERAGRELIGEANACGAEEVKVNPSLRAMERLGDRCMRAARGGAA